MTLDEYILKLEAAQAALPELISDAAKNATIRAVEAAQEKTPPTADSLSGTNTRSGELKQHWATDSKIIPGHQDGQYVTELNNNKEYASFVNDGHPMNRHFVPGLYVNSASGLLEYDPGRKGEVGIMVGTKTRYVPGVYMLEAGQLAYEDTIKAEMEQVGTELERMLK
nr:MAG TPA: putative tail component [Caudoviricetes sp.]